MEFTQKFSAMTQAIVKEGKLSNTPFTLLDIGCSGGIARFWRVFTPSLIAIGIDPVKSEINRLREHETLDQVQYINQFIGLPNTHPLTLKRHGQEPWGGNPWNRLSAATGAEIIRAQTKQSNKLAVLNDWQGSDLADPAKSITIDDLVKEMGLPNIDFIKIDIDGYDLDVIHSSIEVSASSPVLGYTLEVNFFGSTSETDHTFHNTDRVMRELGFDLFDLSIRKYSTSALPAPFIGNSPAQTQFGRPLQGDALYLRDPMAATTRGAAQCPPLPIHKLLKLICLFECFGLPDHAAELIINYRAQLEELCAPVELLDLLARQVDPKAKSYDEYIQKFKSDPTSFYHSKMTR